MKCSHLRSLTDSLLNVRLLGVAEKLWQSSLRYCSGLLTVMQHSNMPSHVHIALYIVQNLEAEGHWLPGSAIHQ